MRWALLYGNILHISSTEKIYHGLKNHIFEYWFQHNFDDIVCIYVYLCGCMYIAVRQEKTAICIYLSNNVQSDG